MVTFLRSTTETVTRPVMATSVLRWRLHGPRRCIGWYDPGAGRRRPCPGSRSTDTSSQCEACTDADPGTWIARDSLRRSGGQPEGTFRAYLALFGRDTVKVGLTAAGRGADRLLEQGAAAHLFVCAGSYAALCEVEELATSRLGFPQQLTWQRKRALWFEPGERGEHARVLTDAAAALRGLLADADVDVLVGETVQHDLPHYGRGLEGLTGRLRVPVHLRDGDVVAGDVAATVGTMLLLPDGDGTVVVDTRALEGWSVSAAAPEEGMHFAFPPVVEAPGAQQEFLFSREPSLRPT